MTVVMTRFSGRTFSTQGMRTVDSRVALRGAVPCAAEAVFAEAKAFLSSREARQMSASDLERELHRRHQELVGKLLQAHRDQRSPKEAAGPAEGASGVECPERREHECHTETTLRTVQVPRPGYASRGHDGLHSLDAALNVPSARCGVDVCHRTTIATAARAPPCTLLPVTAALDLVRGGAALRSTKKSPHPFPISHDKPRLLLISASTDSQTFDWHSRACQSRRRSPKTSRQWKAVRALSGTGWTSYGS